MVLQARLRSSCSHTWLQQLRLQHWNGPLARSFCCRNRTYLHDHVTLLNSFYTTKQQWLSEHVAGAAASFTQVHRPMVPCWSLRVMVLMQLVLEYNSSRTYFLDTCHYLSLVHEAQDQNMHLLKQGTNIDCNSRMTLFESSAKHLQCTHCPH
jgi:hypothetical protein